MRRTTISLPAELHEEAKKVGLNVSAVCRRAIELELMTRKAGRQSQRDVLEQVLADPDGVAQRLRSTLRTEDDEHRGYELGAIWAAKEATLRELEAVVSAIPDQDPQFDSTIPDDNSAVGFIERQAEIALPRADYSAQGGPALVDLESSALLRGFRAGATAVHREVERLVNPPLPSGLYDYGPDEAPF